MNLLISPLYACISSFKLCTLSCYRNLPSANQIKKIISISEVSEPILDIIELISPMPLPCHSLLYKYLHHYSGLYMI